MSDSKIFIVHIMTGDGEDGRGPLLTSRLYFGDKSAANDVSTRINEEGGRSVVYVEKVFNTMEEYLITLPLDEMTRRFPDHPETRKVLERRGQALAKLTDEDKKVLGLYL